VCGESFPLEPTGETIEEDPVDGMIDAMDRRVELFSFADGLGVLPPPPGTLSDRSAPELPEWRKRARQTLEYSQIAQRLDFCFSS
jgi:hypothetical protein